MLRKREASVGRTLESDDERLGFQLFAVLTGLAALVLFSERRYVPVVNDGIVPMPIVVPVALAVAMAWRPSSVTTCLSFWATYTYFLYLGFPQNNTNQTLTFFVGLAVVGSALVCMLRERTVRISGATLFREFAPVVRLLVVGLYFWTVWHKLNTDFLDPEVSCASRLSADMLKGFGVDVFPDPLAAPAVAVTLLAEAALPVGLFFRRTQRATALLALVFHWLLGAAGFYGFSATMMALLPLFLAPAAGRAFAGYAGRVALNRLALASYVLLMILAATVLRIDVNRIGKQLWLALPAIAVVAWWMNRRPVHGTGSPAPIWLVLSRPSPLFLVPVALFLNGASPFLGFKTEYSFAMYSNLRTEGGRTNHLLWKTPLRLAGYQTDLVRVLEGSDPDLLSRLGGRPITRYELTSTMWGIVKEQRRASIPLVLEVDGQRREYRAADSEPDLLVRPSYLERKLLRFRRIVPSMKGRCAH